MKFKIEICKMICSIESIYSSVALFCRPYIVHTSDNENDVSIKINEEDIEKEKSIVDKTEKDLPDSLIEINLVYRKISESMLDHSIFLMHGSVIALDNSRCYMFTAPSGTGKTTHTNIWKSNIPNSFIVNGDKPLLKVEENQVLASGTPWCGKERQNVNCQVPLKGICILERGEHNSITEISFKEALPTLVMQTYCPKDSDKLSKTINLLYAMSSKVKFYKMKMNNLEKDAFITSYKVMVEDSESDNY